MYKYTLAFIKRANKVLMLNRNRSPWMGSWNGVGGKIELNETPIDSLIREVLEETGLIVTKANILFKGSVTWNESISSRQGLLLYLINVPDSLKYQTPKVTDEGILDWKDISWISNFDNYGVCDNIPYFINDVLNNDELFEHYCYFDDKILKEVIKLPFERGKK